jgi:hypothetical protein
MSSSLNRILSPAICRRRKIGANTRMAWAPIEQQEIIDPGLDRDVAPSKQAAVHLMSCSITCGVVIAATHPNQNVLSFCLNVAHWPQMQRK